MSMLFKTHLHLARISIRENKTRSFLTCLGIAIGVASIILILSLMGGISNLVKSEVNEIGADLIVVRPSKTKDTISNIVEELTSANSFQKSNLRISDIEEIKKIVDEYIEIYNTKRYQNELCRLSPSQFYQFIINDYYPSYLQNIFPEEELKLPGWIIKYKKKYKNDK